MEARVAVLEQIAKSTDAALGRIEARFHRIEGRLDRMDARLDQRFDKVSAVHDRDFRLTFGALVALALGLAGLMAKGFRWF